MNLTLLKIIPETIDVYRRVYPYANVRSVCTAFYVLLGEGWSRLCLSPRVLFLNAQRGCLWVYYTTDPVRSAAHTRAREE